MRYEIKGEPLPVVVCELEAGETMVTEAGSMSWMSPNMLMETSGGGAKKMFGKLLSGESMFRNHYTAQGGPGSIAFAASFPGSIRAIEITPDKPVVLQKRAFLACTAGVEFNVFFQKKCRESVTPHMRCYMLINACKFCVIDNHTSNALITKRCAFLICKEMITI